MTVFLPRPNMLNKCFMKPVRETKPPLVIYQRENIMKQKNACLETKQVSSLCSRQRFNSGSSILRTFKRASMTSAQYPGVFFKLLTTWLSTLETPNKNRLFQFSSWGMTYLCNLTIQQFQLHDLSILINQTRCEQQKNCARLWTRIVHLHGVQSAISFSIASI